MPTAAANTPPPSSATSPTTTECAYRWDVRDSAGDNTVTESFFATIKAELINRRAWPTRTAAHKAIFDYIEGRHNTRRLHSSLSYLSPSTYETRHHATHNTTDRQIA
ncbi:IS3 family transposase [Amycolatopsis sulphurea]|uniref:IS3 family transposase n=1 Tax=Amycolatopsis sulphurea TaxID=76022 RepID=UPI000BF7DC4E